MPRSYDLTLLFELRHRGEKWALVMRTWINGISDIQLLETISSKNRETNLMFPGSLEVSKTRH